MAISWVSTDAWSVAATPGRSGRPVRETGVRLRPLRGFSLATLIVRLGHESTLHQLVRARLALDLPDAGHASCSAEADIVWSAPGQWLVFAASGSLADLPALFAGVAAVTDQSDARALVRIEGVKAREALAKGVAIDLHPTMFSIGSSAVTSLAHVGVQIWQVDAAPAFIVSVPRSFAAGVWSWLLAASAADGCEVIEASA